MKGIAFLAVALASLSPTALAQQTELGGKVRSGQEVVVASGETVQGDLIASAGTVRIDGRVDGDLVASGGQVTVAGTVTGGSRDVLGGVLDSGIDADHPELTAAVDRSASAAPPSATRAIRRT